MKYYNKNIDLIEQIFRELEDKPLQHQKIIPISIRKLKEAIDKWLLIKDEGLVKVLVATVIANKLKGDPVWLFIVTASGGAKTELIRGLNKIDVVYPISDLTPQTFLSGEKSNKNASLLLRLPNNAILTFKDFTTVLTMHRDKRHVIISQLREIYDGQFKKEFGTGETKEWRGKIGFITGVTTIIDTHYSIYQTLGERFIQYRPEQADEIKISLKAINNSGYEDEMREEIENAIFDFISGIGIPNYKVEIPEQLKNQIANLASFCAKARSHIVREGYSTREIQFVPEPELPTRLSKQLVMLCSALFLISRAFTKEDYGLIYKIGMDTLPQNRKLAIEILSNTNDFLNTNEIALKIGYPLNTTRRILEDLSVLKLIDRLSKGQGYVDKWIISDRTRELLGKARP
jgi:hypothetical protein